MKTTITIIFAILNLTCLTLWGQTNPTVAPTNTNTATTTTTNTVNPTTTFAQPANTNRPATAYTPDNTTTNVPQNLTQKSTEAKDFLWFFNNHFKLLVLLMILAGLLGGVASYFIYIADKPIAVGGIMRQILISMAASFLIPLFLQMVSSTILSESEKNPLQYFVLFSFCLIGSLFSTRFIQTVGERVLQDMERKYDELYKSVETIMTNETEPTEIKPEVYTTKGRSIETQGTALRTDISDNELNVLRAMRKRAYTFRNIMGISNDAQLDLPEVKEHLSNLQKKGLVERKPGGTEWYITAAGKKID